MPLPPGAEDKIAKFGAGTELPPALPQPAAPPLASPNDPGPVNDIKMPEGESVRVTKPMAGPACFALRRMTQTIHHSKKCSLNALANR